MKLEICTGSIESVIAAHEGGADRVELCSALSEGGVTPSMGLMKQARQVPGIQMNVLIRPRGGDFLYSPEEVGIMVEDIKAAHEIGADGVVIGALTANGQVDMDSCRKMIEAAGEMSITFHRAFDMVEDADQALEDIISLGCDRILTSGLMPSALEGVNTLSRLVEKANGRIIIMPGAGVSPDNAALIMKSTHATEIHASARSQRGSMMEYRNPTVTMGAKDADEYARKETDANIVRQIAESIHALEA